MQHIIKKSMNTDKIKEIYDNSIKENKKMTLSDEIEIQDKVPLQFKIDKFSQNYYWEIPINKDIINKFDEALIKKICLLGFIMKENKFINKK